MKRFLWLVICFVSSVSYSQVPFPHISNSTNDAERVAKFGVIDASTDFLEITNSTAFGNSFIPSIWAHQQSDNRFVLRHFATTTTSFDNGTNPIMIFRTEIRNSLNLAAPAGGSFPWGTTANNIINRPLFSWENGNTQLVRILANGNFGIGTTTPTALLHAVGSVRFENIADATLPARILGTDAFGNLFEYSPTEIAGGPAISDQDWIKPDGSSATSINDNIYTNGNVGINVTNPATNLHTNGTIRFENIANASGPAKILGTDTAGNVLAYDPSEIAGGTGVSDFDWLRPDGAVASSINDNIYTNGKVAINTSVFPNMVGDVNVSDYGLFVTGGILTEEVRVALTSEWADYVFADDYDLDPLENVESFINRNGHLKNIPSAKEVAANGIEIGEMNKLLLLKIEELTLYVIELNKKLELQRSEIEILKSK